MSTQENIALMLDVFAAIERREDKGLTLIHPDFEIHWPPSLPYGGVTRGVKPIVPSWGTIWAPLQPTEAERHMDPRVIGAYDNEVAILWRQRGVSPAGERFDGEVVGLYQLRAGKCARAQMFHFDTTAVSAFLARARDAGAR